MDKEASSSSKEASSSSKEDKCEVPWPAYAQIFELQQKLGNEKNWAFLCKICCGKKIIYASKTSTANLRKHISVSLYLQHFLLRIIDIWVYA